MTSAISPPLCPSQSPHSLGNTVRDSKTRPPLSYLSSPAVTLSLQVYLRLRISRSFISPLFSLTFPLCYSLPFHISFPLLSWFNTNTYLAHVSGYKLDRCTAFCVFFFFCSVCLCFYIKKSNNDDVGKVAALSKSPVPSCFFFLFLLAEQSAFKSQKKKADLFLKSAYDIDCSFYQPDNHDRK